jgi:hypothetical protein
MYELSYLIVPGIPLDVELAGTALEIVKFAAKISTLTVRTDGVPDGSLRTTILSVADTLAAVGNCEIFLELSATIYS